jgi:hypothetical protein
MASNIDANCCSGAAIAALLGAALPMGSEHLDRGI